MVSNEDREVYMDAIRNWGVDAQIDMVYEECGELLTAVSRLRRGRCTIDDVVTEMADVSIMIDQLNVMFNLGEKFDKEKSRKINKLRDKLNEYTKKNKNAIID